MAIHVEIKNILPKYISNNFTKISEKINSFYIFYWLYSLAHYNSYKVKVKSSMARSPPVENLLPQKVGSIINYFQ